MSGHLVFRAEYGAIGEVIVICFNPPH